MRLGDCYVTSFFTFVVQMLRALKFDFFSNPKILLQFLKEKMLLFNLVKILLPKGM
jgi:hypothetical protein